MALTRVSCKVLRDLRKQMPVTHFQPADSAWVVTGTHWATIGSGKKPQFCASARWKHNGRSRLAERFVSEQEASWEV